METHKFKIGSFNLYNLVLPEHKFYRDRYYSKVAFNQKKKWIANQLNQMNCDIVGLQEIFHIDALKQVLQETDVYQHINIVTGIEKGDSPILGLITHFKVVAEEYIVDFPQTTLLQIDGNPVPIRKFSRPVIKATLEVRPGLQVIVFVVHLKSKNPKFNQGADRDDPVQQAIGQAKSLLIRAAEATALRYLLVDALKGNENPVILLGDINDSGAAVTSEIMSGSPPWRKLSFNTKRHIWDMLLYNVKDIQARQSYRDVYYSHIHNGHYESLDHIFVSQEFVRQNPNHLGYIEYVKVFNDHLIDDTLSEDAIPVWQSDHGQVVATIQLR